MLPPIIVIERGDYKAVIIKEGKEVRCNLLLEKGDLGLIG